MACGSNSFYIWSNVHIHVLFEGTVQSRNKSRKYIIMMVHDQLVTGVTFSHVSYVVVRHHDVSQSLVSRGNNVSEQST